MVTVVSKYRPIWNELKQTGVCKITAPPVLHPRIIKAVSKRKLEDLAFQFEVTNAGKVLQLKHRKEGTVIIFTLEKLIGIGDL